MKRFKKGMCAALALVISAAALTGCGKTSEEDETKANVERDEFVYTAEYIPVQGTFADWFNSVSFAGDCFYISSYERVAVPVSEEENSAGDDGEVVAFAESDTEAIAPATDSDLDPGEGMTWDTRPVIYRVGLDGSCDTVRYAPEETEPEEGVDTSSDVRNICVGPDGTMYLLTETYRSWDDAPEGVTPETDEDYYEKYYHWEESFALHALGEDGSIARTIDLNGLKQNGEDYFYVNGIEIGGGNEIYLTAEQGLYVLDADGNLKTTIESDDWIDSMFRLPDGRIACSVYADRGMHLSVADVEAGSFGEEIEAPSGAYNLIPGGGEHDFYYTNGSNFFSFDLDNPEPVRVLNWVNCDVDSNNTRSTAVLDDGRIVCLTTDYENYAATRYGRETWDSLSVELTVLTKVPSDTVPQKEIITLATQSLAYNVRSQIIEFNKSSDKYRIEVWDYSEYNDYTSDNEADYYAGATKLETEIMSGNVPDIIDLNRMPVKHLIAKGLLEDLYPYIDSDAALSREDMMQNVLKAYEIDGKLYRTLSNFYIMTVLGARSLVGDTPGWTMDDLNAALAEMPEGCTVFDQYVTRPNILQTCLYLDIDDYVDWASGKTNFESEQFVKLLEFAAGFPADFDWESYYGEDYVYSEEDEVDYRLANGLQMLMSTVVSDFRDLQMYNALFGGAATCIGYPTEHGTGNMFESDGASFAMSSKCANKDAAWSFLRQFFTEDYQSNDRYSWGFPTNAKAFEKKLTEAMTPEYEKDENGNYILDDDGNRIEVDEGSWGWGGTMIQMHALNEEEAAQIRELIDTTTKVLEFDESVYEIVEEEAAAFFAGQKSAEETARLIQSKAMIYVNEQR